jgi:hypothetical protein
MHFRPYECTTVFYDALAFQNINFELHHISYSYTIPLVCRRRRRVVYVRLRSPHQLNNRRTARARRRTSNNAPSLLLNTDTTLSQPHYSTTHLTAAGDACHRRSSSSALSRNAHCSRFTFLLPHSTSIIHTNTPSYYTRSTLLNNRGRNHLPVIHHTPRGSSCDNDRRLDVSRSPSRCHNLFNTQTLFCTLIDMRRVDVRVYPISAPAHASQFTPRRAHYSTPRTTFLAASCRLLPLVHSLHPKKQHNILPPLISRTALHLPFAALLNNNTMTHPFSPSRPATAHGRQR